MTGTAVRLHACMRRARSPIAASKKRQLQEMSTQDMMAELQRRKRAESDDEDDAEGGAGGNVSASRLKEARALATMTASELGFVPAAGGGSFIQETTRAALQSAQQDPLVKAGFIYQAPGEAGVATWKDQRSAGPNGVVPPKEETASILKGVRTEVPEVKKPLSYPDLDKIATAVVTREIIPYMQSKGLDIPGPTHSDPHSGEASSACASVKSAHAFKFEKYVSLKQTLADGGSTATTITISKISEMVRQVTKSLIKSEDIIRMLVHQMCVLHEAAFEAEPSNTEDFDDVKGVTDLRMADMAALVMELTNQNSIILHSRLTEMLGVPGREMDNTRVGKSEALNYQQLVETAQAEDDRAQQLTSSALGSPAAKKRKQEIQSVSRGGARSSSASTSAGGQQQQRKQQQQTAALKQLEQRNKALENQVKQFRNKGTGSDKKSGATDSANDASKKTKKGDGKPKAKKK